MVLYGVSNSKLFVPMSGSIITAPRLKLLKFEKLGFSPSPVVLKLRHDALVCRFNFLRASHIYEGYSHNLGILLPQICSQLEVLIYCTPKRLKVNFKKTKLMVSGSKGEILKSKVDPCS